MRKIREHIKGKGISALIVFLGTKWACLE